MTAIPDTGLAQRLTSQSSAVVPCSWNQLGGWACQARPLQLLPTAEPFAFEAAVEVLTRRQHVIDNPGELERDQGARDGDGFSSGFRPIERPDLRKILHRPNGRVTEGEFEIPIPRLRPRAVARAAARIIGAWDESAVREELFGRGKPRDAIDLGVERERVDFANARDPQKALNICVGNESGMQRGLEGVDLVVEEIDLRLMT